MLFPVIFHAGAEAYISFKAFLVKVHIFWYAVYTGKQAVKYQPFPGLTVAVYKGSIVYPLSENYKLCLAVNFAEFLPPAVFRFTFRGSYGHKPDNINLVTVFLSRTNSLILRHMA